MLHLILWLALRALMPDTRQCLVVTSADWHTPRATLQRYQRHLGHWQSVGPPWIVALGRSGMAATSGLAIEDPTVPHKHEGDGCSPAGVFALVQMFGWGTETAHLGPGHLPLLRVLPSSRCVDDAASQYYNHIVDGRHVTKFSSAEKMQIPEYRLGVVVDHNLASPTPGDGSCIFLHIWDGPDDTTAGCTAMSLEHMRALVRWLRADAHPMIIEMPRQLYSAQRQEHGWP